MPIPAEQPPSAVRFRGLAVALRRAMFGVGPIATLRALLQGLRRGEPGSKRPKQATSQQTAPFDAAFGVETGGFQSWRELQSGGANDPYISGYLGVAPSVARRLIGLVPDPGAYTFLDLGCGKGRALILASERPFRRVIGVEIAAGLAETASRNAVTIRSAFPERTAITVVHGDAAAFLLPPEPLVVFLYQPFELPVMRRVLARLVASLLEAPRPIVILYVNPALGRVFDREPRLERVANGELGLAEEERAFAYGGQGHSDSFSIWRTRSPAPSILPL